MNAAVIVYYVFNERYNLFLTAMNICNFYLVINDHLLLGDDNCSYSWLDLINCIIFKLLLSGVVKGGSYGLVFHSLCNLHHVWQVDTYSHSFTLKPMTTNLSHPDRIRYTVTSKAKQVSVDRNKTFWNNQAGPITKHLINFIINKLGRSQDLLSQVGNWWNEQPGVLFHI